MKKILVLSISFASLIAQAQNVKLEKGKKITSKSIMSMDMDMGMGGQMKMKTNTNSFIEITGADNKNYTATNTVTKITSNSEMMGKKMDYDSDKKEDRDGEMGKQFSKMLGKTVQLNIDKTTGRAKEIELVTKIASEDEDNGNPFAGLMGSGEKVAEGSTDAAFYIVPIDKKVGDKWSENTEIQGLKAVKNYELKNLENGIATLLIKSTGKGTISKEVKGMTIELDMETVGENTMIVDTKTSLVKKNNGTTDVSGTMGVMGQTMPITIKTIANSEFE